VIFDGLPEQLTPDIVSQIYSGLEDDSISQLVLRMAEKRRQQRILAEKVA
jgi:phosphonate transport system ATP-binding protein